MKFTKIAADLQISRQTVASRLNNLIDMGLLKYDEVKKRYEFITIQKDLAALLPKPTVRILCNTLRERSLSILAYLLKSYFQHGQKPFNINIDILKAQVGLSSANRGTNNEVITDTLILLKKLGFIDYKVVKEMESGRPQKQIGMNIKYSADLKVAGTPYLIIDGHEVRGAITNYNRLKAELD